jgi:hypothetical protein
VEEEDILREHKKQRNYIIDLYRLLIQARDGMAYRKSVKEINWCSVFIVIVRRSLGICGNC